MKKNNSGSDLTGLNHLVRSTNSRAPHADVSNAPELMGDIQGPYGDADDDVYGDPDTSALDTYNSLIGDADDGDEYGAPKKQRKGFSRTVRKVLPYAAAGAGAVAGTIAIRDIIRRRQARRAAVAKNLAQNSADQTIANQIRARRLMGKISRTSEMPFYQLTGATLNSFPLAPTEAFPADTLKFNLDRQSTDTPFEVEIVNGTFAGVTWTVSATGTVATRFYTAVIVVVGISVLTANPGTIFNLTGVLPTINGTLTIAANPFSFTIRDGYYAKLLIFPWILVTNKPVLALGAYNNASPITLALTGLPSNASVSMVVPGSLHSWTIGMRNRLVS